MGQSLAGLIMVHISYTSVSLFLLSLESSLSHPTPSPFLLDLLAPHVQVSRREGKQVNDGYGVPDDTYGAPVSSTVSSYEAPKYSSSTVPPCSYQAPTTTTTPPPSYGAPGRHQEQPVLPDILGFIGGILKPKNQESHGDGCLSAPVEDGYGVPQETSYTAPETDAYEAPQSDSYDSPHKETYEAPVTDSYEAPEKVSYDASADNVDEIAVNERINPIDQ